MLFTQSKLFPRKQDTKREKVPPPPDPQCLFQAPNAPYQPESPSGQAAWAGHTIWSRAYCGSAELHMKNFHSKEKSFYNVRE